MKRQSIKKILVANRGEIAVRVIRACREMGITAVAVFSEADRAALHVRMADEAVAIGPAPSRDSYLRQEKILAAAQELRCDAIHPGYGFLAENPEFAEKVQQAGLIFIGPDARAMRLMGDKTSARQCMLAAGIPVVPGTENALADEAEAKRVAAATGYPVMLKAAAGGGGKGMRLVKSANEVASAFRAAVSEAKSAFGDGRVYIEKYIGSPRHIEFQILADHHGHVIHLGERECSIQRRHQKVIEEAPASVLDAELRQTMGETAVRAAQACDYRNAGTIEFMFDKNRQFYFLEMNTRLQVEHPVTEMITGLDLVKQQIRIASGEKLALTQEEVQFRGHAVECRIYAEDPANNFLPSTGTLSFLSPAAGPGVRDDSGFLTGNEISIYYDPLISKLVTWGSDREEAIVRMRRALSEYRVHGVATSIPFCEIVMRHPRFLAGDFDTHFIDDEFMNVENTALTPEGTDSSAARVAAIAAAIFHHAKGSKSKPGAQKSDSGDKSAWKLLGRRRALR